MIRRQAVLPPSPCGSPWGRGGRGSRSRRRLVVLALSAALTLTLSGCAGGGFLARLFGHRAPPAPPPALHYTVGDPYRAEGVWHYPAADFSLDETGLATVAPPRPSRPPQYTADGEPYDPTAMAAGHATLQLPAIVRVTNLQNGRSALLRVNDRGPASPARVLELTPRAAELLGAQDGTELRIQEQEDASRQLAAAMQGNGPPLALATAPPGEIKAESLAPPSGAPGGSARGRAAPAMPHPAATAAERAPPPAPERLPEQVSEGPPQPGRLFITVGSFSQPQYARLMAGRLSALGAEVVTDYAAPRDRAFIVRLGPFDGVAEADAGLDRARNAGVTEGRIIVQP